MKELMSNIFLIAGIILVWIKKFGTYLSSLQLGFPLNSNLKLGILLLDGWSGIQLWNGHLLKET